MTTLTMHPPTLADDPGVDPALRAQIDAACARVAPAWPLDRLIAVNPHWGWVARPITEAAAELHALSGARFHLPRRWYREALASGRLTPADLRRALEVIGSTRSLDSVLAAIEEEAPTVPTHPLITALRDGLHDTRREVSWHDLAMGSIGRACESWFDVDQATWQPDRTSGLFGLWRALARAERGPRLLLDVARWTEAVDELPTSPLAVIEEALETLGVHEGGRTDYLTAALLSVNGWASLCAFRRWEARLQQQEEATIECLLAMRLAWDLLLYRTARGTDLAGRWHRARAVWRAQAALVPSDHEVDWILLRALELRYHERLAAALVAVPSAPVWRFGQTAPATTRVQAVFCIDVRSEVLRRALESHDAGIQTLGFAGFFGLPLAYAPVAGPARPQLPGLLAPTVVAGDMGTGLDGARARTAQAAADARAWDALATGAVGAFPMVEATGIAALASLVRADIATTIRPGDAARHGLDDPTVRDARPVLTRRLDGTPLETDDRVRLAADVLRGLGLTEGFARLVAFLGHGATVTNNPQAAGLACGACGGQSGEVNARALAALLNDPVVRDALRTEGIVIPPETAFVGGVHDTVTDGVTLYPEAVVRLTHGCELEAFAEDLLLAGDAVRRERAASLRIPEANRAPLRVALERRAADWSEVRPEWALARNAAFIAAPRSRTRPLRLDGRAFLHEYDWRQDRGFTALTTILTAPVVVAHWINMQYLASTVDPTRYGSGDKTLHNVVGRRIGVYEGAGGDLRIGLAHQSVHDGTDIVHEPLRLAVYVEAPAPAIDTIIAEHPVVRDLVANGWIHLYRIDGEGAAVYVRRTAGWEPVAVRGG
ncbi:MAG: hypothetical protein RLZZ25_1074 [Gemmatimonadota bacterium]